jgi:hypothetical protein
MARGDEALVWIKARWDRIVGEPLSRKIEPASLTGRRLTLRLLDPAWRKPVEATLPELERKLAFEIPEVKPRVVLGDARAGTGDAGRGTRKARLD